MATNDTRRKQAAARRTAPALPFRDPRSHGRNGAAGRSQLLLVDEEAPFVRFEGEGIQERLGAAERLRVRRARREEELASLPARERNRRRFSARHADRHELYQYSVQSPREDAAFLARVYEKSRGRAARHFREDFCGTGLLSSAWVRRHRENSAEGYDIDPDPLAWGIVHNFRPLGPDAARALLRQKDVREPSVRRPDVRCAQNFSYWIFTERPVMLDYFRNVREDLAEEGAFVIDVHGGPEASEEVEERRKIEEGFTYVWDQRHFYPITGEAQCAIHFEFRDGTSLRNAFRYQWRIWSLTELRDLLLDAGFRGVDCYWEGTAENGEDGNGIFRRATKGENCPSWIAYLVALR
jgi:hypothetical protein